MYVGTASGEVLLQDAGSGEVLARSARTPPAAPAPASGARARVTCLAVAAEGVLACGVEPAGSSKASDECAPDGSGSGSCAQAAPLVWLERGRPGHARLRQLQEAPGTAGAQCVAVGAGSSERDAVVVSTGGRVALVTLMQQQAAGGGAEDSNCKRGGAEGGGAVSVKLLADRQPCAGGAAGCTCVGGGAAAAQAAEEAGQAAAAAAAGGSAVGGGGGGEFGHCTATAGSSSCAGGSELAQRLGALKERLAALLAQNESMPEGQRLAPEELILDNQALQVWRAHGTGIRLQDLSVL